eukprot:COSAG03_NODE_5463_length_1245_cov_1.070681_1_plen_167_part_00
MRACVLGEKHRGGSKQQLTVREASPSKPWQPRSPLLSRLRPFACSGPSSWVPAERFGTGGAAAPVLLLVTRQKKKNSSWCEDTKLGTAPVSGASRPVCSGVTHGCADFSHDEKMLKLPRRLRRACFAAFAIRRGVARAECTRTPACFKLGQCSADEACASRDVTAA